MQLSLKIGLAIGLLISVALAIEGTLSFQQEVEFATQDMAQNSELLATHLAQFSDTLSNEALLKRVSAIDQNTGPTISWRPSVEDPTASLRTTTHISTDTVTAISPINGGINGFIVVSQSTHARDALLTEALLTITLTAIAVTLVSALTGLWIGGRLVGSRVLKLIQFTERVGHEDFSHPSALTGNDELSQLGRALNTMAEQLERANRRYREATEARIEAERQLRHADRLRTVGQLAAGLAHELGSPLNVILGRVSLAKRELIDAPATTKHLTIIETQTQRITRLIRQLLDFSRQHPAQKSRLDFCPFVAQSVELLNTTGTNGRHNIHLSSSGKQWVYADAQQLEQVLTNLIINAIQAITDDGSVYVSLSDVHPNQVLLCIEDDGPGVPESIQKTIFDPFFTTKECGKGTGLGLSVVHGILSEHDATIQLDTSPRHGGARFSILFKKERT